MHVTELVRVNSFVARMLPANPRAQNIAASIPKDSPVASGRAIINTPIKPKKIR